MPKAWTFKASKPKAEHPVGAYFTTLEPNQPNLSARLGVPRWKLAFLFAFSGDDGLKALDGSKGRGQFIFSSPVDYTVAEDRQVFHGKTDEYKPKEAV